MAMERRFYNFILCAAMVCLVILLSGFILYKNIEKTQFHGDESSWISSAYYYTDLLLKRDFSLDKWEGLQLGTSGSAYNLHLGQWLMGIPLKWYSRRNAREFLNPYDFRLTEEENKRMGKIPPQDILFFTRGISIIFGVLCCLLAFTIGYCSRNLWIGLIMAILIMRNKLFITFATRAMTDIYYNLFLLCACLFILLLAKSLQKKSFILLCFFCGVFAGLATSVKITGMVVISLLFLISLIYEGFVNKKGQGNIMLGIVIFSFSAIAVVYMLNPYFWDLSHPLKFPYMFRRLDILLSRQVKEYGSGWEPNRLWVFHRSLGLEHSNFSFEWIFLFSGMILFTVNLIYSLYKKNFNLWAIPFLFFVVNYFIILIFMKINWDRYYLPTIIASKFIVASLIYDAVSFSRQFFIKITRQTIT